MPKTESSRAKTLLRKINKELSSIPNYKYSPPSLKLGERGAPALAQAVGNAATALRRGLRSMQGGESKPSLELKRKRVKDLIAETEEMKKTGFDLGTKPMAAGKEGYTTRSKSETIAAGNKRRREMR
jgi:hypothetical protein|tara:strand:- start:382 stop:762 length:381 start_codon:yes stop_codon:yes gene_type:complete